MNTHAYTEDCQVCIQAGICVYIHAFLPFLPFFPTRHRNIPVICANNHTHRIVINDKNVNLFQQIITFQGDFLK